MKQITIDEKILVDLREKLEDIQLEIESLELMNDKELMKDLEESERQIKNREFANWDEL
tara:strand:- start:289 stop:465 length:177 start_codon:yes stop_codon:yes gene_type:complete